jgi:hypothetical protein
LTFEVRIHRTIFLRLYLEVLVRLPVNKVCFRFELIWLMFEGID